MIEVKGNLWDYPANARVITTNGTVKKNGECVMGRGCALEAKRRWTTIPRDLGQFIRSQGNHVFWLGEPDLTWSLYSFPVKHQWFERADLKLIEQSAHELNNLTGDDGLDDEEDTVIVLPRPGCGNGNLKWNEVKPVIEPILDDRFHVITF